MKTRLLIVDDEEEFVHTLSERLTMRDYDVTTALSGEEAIEKVKDYNFDVVILDVSMPGMSGVEALGQIKKIKPLIEVIMLTGHATVESAVDGMKLGALDYLLKPCKNDELIQKITAASDRKAEHEQRIRDVKVQEIIASPRSVLK